MSSAPTRTDGAWLGELLRSLRLQKGRSLRQTAEKSGIGRSTLSRWERGAARPDPCALAPLFDALNLSPQDRCSIEERLADRKQPDRQIAARRRLLRAARLRSQLSLGQAAQRVGVAKATLSRWESGERWPGSVRLAEAAKCLGATESEIQAIAAPGPLVHCACTDSPSLHERVQQLRSGIATGSSSTLDLDFLGLDAAIAQTTGPEAKRLRLELRAAYVEWLGWWYRDAEAGMYAARLLPALRREPDSRVWGRVLRACSNYANEFRFDPEAAIELLSGACDTLQGGPSEGFVRRELSGLYLNVGDLDAARDQLQRAIDSGSGEEAPEAHAYCCGMIEAEIWSVAGKHDRAIEALPAVGVGDAYLQCSSAIGKSRVLLRAGDRLAARRILEDTMTYAQAQGLAHFQKGLAEMLAMPPLGGQ